jgi:hypothetical protein
MTAASFITNEASAREADQARRLFRIPGNTSAAEPDGSTIAPRGKATAGAHAGQGAGAGVGDCRGCECSSVAEIAEVEGFNKSYVSQILWLARIVGRK